MTCVRSTAGNEVVCDRVPVESHAFRRWSTWDSESSCNGCSPTPLFTPISMHPLHLRSFWCSESSMAKLITKSKKSTSRSYRLPSLALIRSFFVVSRDDDLYEDQPQCASTCRCNSSVHVATCPPTSSQSVGLSASSYQLSWNASKRTCLSSHLARITCT